MLIQEVSLQSAIPSCQLSMDGYPFAPAAIPPACHFASSFSSSRFTPTSILIELFGALSHPVLSEKVGAGILLGLSGLDAAEAAVEAATEAAAVDTDAILASIRNGRFLLLNRSMEVPLLPSEDLVHHSSSLTTAHTDGFRLTAYHCVHPLVTRQFYATTWSNPPLNAGGNTLHFTEC